MKTKGIAAVRNQMISAMVSNGMPRETVERICITEEDFAVIKDIIAEVQPRRICEVGSYVGVSTCLLALYSDAYIVAVDPNFSVYADVAKDGYVIDKKTRTFFEVLVETFNLSHRITRFDAYFSCLPSQKSLEFHKECNPDIHNIQTIDSELEQWKPFDMVFIDGDHYASSVFSDLTKSLDMVTEHSVFILHDMCGYWGEQVKQGIAMFLDNNPSFVFECRGNIGIVKIKRWTH